MEIYTYRKNNYITSLYKDYLQISDYLPESNKNILDLGCGVGEINIFLNKIEKCPSGTNLTASGTILGTYETILGTYETILGTHGRILGTSGSILGGFGRLLGAFGRTLGASNESPLAAMLMSLRW